MEGKRGNSRATRRSESLITANPPDKKATEHPSASRVNDTTSFGSRVRLVAVEVAVEVAMVAQTQGRAGCSPQCTSHKSPISVNSANLVGARLAQHSQSARPPPSWASERYWILSAFVLPGRCVCTASTWRRGRLQLGLHGHAWESSLIRLGIYYGTRHKCCYYVNLARLLPRLLARIPTNQTLTIVCALS